MKDTEKCFLWIVEILERNNVTFQIMGGFAAKIYGVQRELADIDIEVADQDIAKIFKDVQPYVIFGPARYKDENWDLNLMTLNYAEQEIDICSNEALIFNQNTKKWEKLASDPTKAKIMKVFGKDIPVVQVEKLIAYKSKLQRDADREDVKQLFVLRNI